MPPSDQEPRYQLVDSNGNVVGSLFGDGSGNVVIADETDTQTTFDADGITTPALEANEYQTPISTPKTDIIDSSKLLSIGPEINGYDSNASTSSTTYEKQFNYLTLRTQWDVWSPNNADTAAILTFRASGGNTSTLDIKVRNTVDGEDILEMTGITPGTRTISSITPYRPTTEGDVTDYVIALRSNDGSSVAVDDVRIQFGIET